MLSCYKFLKPEKIFIHTNVDEFSGQYWEKVCNWNTIKVVLNRMCIPPIIGGKHYGYGTCS